MRCRNGVDDLLNARALREIALVEVSAFEDFAAEVVNQIAVEYRAPWIIRLVTGREVS